jgi:hypothetical protein
MSHFDEEDLHDAKRMALLSASEQREADRKEAEADKKEVDEEDKMEAEKNAKEAAEKIKTAKEAAIKIRDEADVAWRPPPLPKGTILR